MTTRDDGGATAERGSVAAELAVALPAVLLVLLLGVGALGAAARQVILQDAVADAARLLGRGEPADAAARALGAGAPGARLSSAHRGDLVCATASAELRIGALIRVPLNATSCALDGGH